MCVCVWVRLSHSLSFSCALYAYSLLCLCHVIDKLSSDSISADTGIKPQTLPKPLKALNPYINPNALNPKPLYTLNPKLLNP